MKRKETKSHNSQDPQRCPKKPPPNQAEKRGAEMSTEELKDAVKETQERADYEEERERREEMSSPAHKERQERLERDAG